MRKLEKQMNQAIRGQRNWNWVFARNFNPSHKVDFISGMFVR